MTKDDHLIYENYHHCISSLEKGDLVVVKPNVFFAKDTETILKFTGRTNNIDLLEVEFIDAIKYVTKLVIITIQEVNWEKTKLLNQKFKSEDKQDAADLLDI
jgi:hypothetical protein